MIKLRHIFMEVDQKMITVMELIPWFNEVQR